MIKTTKLHTAPLLVALATAVVVLLGGCRKETTHYVTFASTLEQPVSDRVDSALLAKTYLHSNESWIYWETGDEIMAYAGEGDGSKLTLMAGENTNDNAYFGGGLVVKEQSTNTEVYAIYPATSGGEKFGNQIVFPAVQPYRTSTSPDPDQSFGRGCLPMVAWTRVGDWEAVGEDPAALDFHSVAGLLRFQFYSSASAEATLESITFTEISSVLGSGHENKQISGTFTVKDANTNTPYLTATGVTDDSRKIVISGIGKTIGGTPAGADSVSASQRLWTFYLALPAILKSDTEMYALQVDVKSNRGTYTHKMKANIARNRINKMPALDIKEWKAVEGQEGVQLVGSGSRQRPFQIYTAAELNQLREAFAAAYRDKSASEVTSFDGSTHRAAYVNGQRVTPNTYFQLMRDDILLTPYNWVDGIIDFVGHFLTATNSPRLHGVTNISQFPVFHSVTADGDVSFFTILEPSETRPASLTCSDEVYTAWVQRQDGVSTGDITFYYTGMPFGLAREQERANRGDTNFSPLCYINYGVLRDCHNRMNVAILRRPNTATGIYEGVRMGACDGGVPGSLAGLCAYNYGSIESGGNEGTLSAAERVYLSDRGYYWLPFGRGNGKAHERRHAAGVCGVNYPDGVVQGFTFTFATLNADSVAGICFVNRGTVRDCQGAFRTYQNPSNWGGIVFYNQVGALIENCDVSAFIWVDTVRRGSQPVSDCNVGGITYFNRGTINHCRNNANLRARHTGGIAVRQDHDDAVIKNCWSSREATVRGYDEVGGLVARLWRGQVLNSYCRSTIKRTSEDNAAHEGGIAAEVGRTAVIKNCYNRYSSFYGTIVDVLSDVTAEVAAVVPAERSAASAHWYISGSTTLKKYDEEFRQVMGFMNDTPPAGIAPYEFSSSSSSANKAAIVYRDAAGNIIDTANWKMLVNLLNENRVSDLGVSNEADESEYDRWYLSYTQNVVEGATLTTYDTIPMLSWQRSNSWEYTNPPSAKRSRRFAGRLGR
ncbi:MAG: hypothetical protein IJ684_00925 [Bacteroidales bacterium]|nr:hypothetical protein [Bacteroidales bacterium]